MTKAPTILQVVPWLDSGGVERGTVDIAAAIIQAGGRALVAGEAGRLVPQLHALGGELLPLTGRSKNPYVILHSNAKALEAMIHEHKVDLVHARSRAPAWSALIAARRTGVPFVTTYHGAYSQKGRIKAFYNSVMAKGDVVIANSHYTADLIASRRPEAKKRIVTIHRGVDMSAFDPAVVSADRVNQLRSQWGVDDRPVIILPSRLTRWKGQSFILPVVGALKQQGMAFQLVLIGDDQGRESYMAELDALIAQYDLHDCVKRVGHCSDMAAAYTVSDLVIVPSQDAETFGRSAAEALAMGKITLVGDLGAQPEVAAPPSGVSAEGWIAKVIRHDDSDGWQKAIASALAQDKGIIANSAPLARQHVEAHFSLDSMGHDTLAIYDGLIGSCLAEDK
ncbi:glycosyltransferase family 4 protein [Cohaesibacter celericrescens]|uniref:Glycosyl transferase n=1 Tax=Cohaesibacter celericrescens TaxID=2067669 RepID=A0A2N5XNS9_9HYPH|nr:glycosyltransferase family 4 protein [Cohaesibacter celericrescens]PLW76135.1 glycosyl transferase [Cohaesibacter celericrescens]